MGSSEGRSIPLYPTVNRKSLSVHRRLRMYPILRPCSLSVMSIYKLQRIAVPPDHLSSHQLRKKKENVKQPIILMEQVPLSLH